MLAQSTGFSVTTVVLVGFEDAHAPYASARRGRVSGALVVAHASLLGRLGATAAAFWKLGQGLIKAIARQPILADFGTV